MKRILMLILLTAAMGIYAAAQQNPADAQASKEDVEKYLKVAHSKELITRTMDALAKPMHQMAHQQCAKEKMPADCEARMNKLHDEMMASMPWDEMLAVMAGVYQKHFTKGDIDNLVAFYSTRTGQKVLNETPAISAESMQEMMPILTKRLEAMSQKMQDEFAAIAKESDGKKAQTNN